MAVEWTKEQRQIIGLRDRNILVAAAAGSGKTAVLVERIMAMITDEKRPVDIDRLLVVTFTNAAAGQMRERIGKRLADLRFLFPENQNLKRQEDLLPHAKIMTIDSFCLYVVKNYFSFLDLDPDFRIGDEGELKLIREEVMGEVLEKQYQEGSSQFRLFVESYGEGKGDRNIAELIDQLYQFAAAYPQPEKQLSRWKEQLFLESEEALEEAAWMKALMEEIHLEAKELKERYEEAVRLSAEAEGLQAYATMFASDLRIADSLLQAENYEAVSGILAVMKKSFMTKPRISKKIPVDEEAKEFLSSLRDVMKKELVALSDAFYLGDKQQIFSDIQKAGGTLGELVDLTIEYGRAFSKEKREKNMVDFSDVAHFAFQILTEEEENGEFRPSETATQMSHSFYEIMIDEYQDSNWIQEAVLNSISKERDGNPNVFMVGDVKQSIYRFRQARPELFMKKYASYTKEDSLYQKIDLHRNFRSRKAVLESANFLFGQLMDKKLGGITYDEDAALIPGRNFPEDEEDLSKQTEIILVDLGRTEKTESDREQEEYEAKELEAQAVAGRIQKLVSPDHGFQVLDHETGALRTARYGDIAILLRTMSGWAEVFTDVLMEMGIPACAQTRTGYFTAREIQCMLNLLRLVDNPMQDIPLAAVMRSPIGAFTSEEMAVLMAESEREMAPGGFRGLYGALMSSSKWKERESGQEKELSLKAERFLYMLSDFRKKAVYMRLHQLLRYILEETGYGCMLAAMPGGNIRKKNMEMLIKRAVDYENTSYQGVFQFVRYIEKLQKYSVDFGEAAPGEGEENTVRITSIHKSKGLEYPIVILAGTGKPFNRQESNGKILFHSELGIAADYIDIDNRVKAATLPKRFFQKALRKEALGEELRILYVALTRAEEKLIITGTDRYLETKLVKWNSLRLTKEETLPYYAVSSAGSYLDWILMALIRNKAYGNILTEQGITPPVFHKLYDREVPVSVCVENVGELVRREVFRQASGQFLREGLTKLQGKKELKEQFKQGLSYRYPYEEAVTAPRKFSVSQLKEDRTEEFPAVSLVPRFMEQEEGLFGAARGTAYHRVLELLSFENEPSDQGISLEITELEKRGLLPEGTGQNLNLGKIRNFLMSPIGRRMAAAKKLKKEQQFVMGIPAKNLKEEYAGTSLSEEILLVQGIIDAWFEEAGELVVVDYKTDRIAGNDREEFKNLLKKHYRIQLDYYQAALEMNTGKRVKERYIYSFSLEEAILV
ncbi:MAG: helicase-exonuclease AddAB subunit AddA [Lachnospiraceae bacterium]|nr:helicase-exonuclease AddAB subunit AddA [Lachnospiraceae bacterium]